MLFDDDAPPVDARPRYPIATGVDDERYDVRNGWQDDEARRQRARAAREQSSAEAQPAAVIAQDPAAPRTGFVKGKDIFGKGRVTTTPAAGGGDVTAASADDRSTTAAPEANTVPDTSWWPRRDATAPDPPDAIETNPQIDEAARPAPRPDRVESPDQPATGTRRKSSLRRRRNPGPCPARYDRNEPSEHAPLAGTTTGRAVAARAARSAKGAGPGGTHHPGDAAPATRGRPPTGRVQPRPIRPPTGCGAAIPGCSGSGQAGSPHLKTRLPPTHRNLAHSTMGSRRLVTRPHSDEERPSPIGTRTRHPPAGSCPDTGFRPGRDDQGRRGPADLLR
jgi:hypothetical protein